MTESVSVWNVYTVPYVGVMMSSNEENKSNRTRNKCTCACICDVRAWKDGNEKKSKDQSIK